MKKSTIFKFILTVVALFSIYIYVEIKDARANLVINMNHTYRTTMPSSSVSLDGTTLFLYMNSQDISKSTRGLLTEQAVVNQVVLDKKGFSNNFFQGFLNSMNRDKLRGMVITNVTLYVIIDGENVRVDNVRI